MKAIRLAVAAAALLPLAAGAVISSQGKAEGEPASPTYGVTPPGRLSKLGTRGASARRGNL